MRDSRRAAKIWEIHCSLVMAECCRLVENILEEAQRLEAFRDRIPFEMINEPQPDIDLQRAVATMITDIAKLANFIEKPKKETKKSKSYALVTERRVKLFAKIFSGISLQEIKSFEARHSLEHFEERIDEAISCELVKSELLSIEDPGTAYFYRLHSKDVTSTMNFKWSGDKVFVRIFTFQDMTFWNFGGKICIDKVKLEVSKMREKLVEFLGPKKYDEYTNTGVIAITGRPVIQKRA